MTTEDTAAQQRLTALHNALQERILILDGAMGTMLQKFNFSDDDFRGNVFRDHSHILKGDNDVLNLTQPQAVLSVHAEYLRAGADIIETNTFNANRFSQQEYGLSDKVYELNRAGAAIARSAADAFTEQDPAKPRFVAGSMGPTGKTLSLSPSVSDPAYRDLTFDELAEAYEEAAAGLIDGGADILLIETSFDTLNVKAAIYAIGELKRKRGNDMLPVPVMISGTIADASGRLLSGQNAEAFLISVSHTADWLSIGFNCALGATEMRPYLAELAAKAPCFISAHPNAGLPDESGHYKQTPEEMARIMRSFADEGLLNIAGGCCGTSPAHIKAIAEAMRGAIPRKRVTPSPALRLAGLDALVSNPELPFINVGERTNVAGSRKFLRLIKEKKYDEAIQIARNQVENGAAVIDINMDDAMIDAKAELSRFLLLLAGEPDIARVPVMIDSSRWDVIRAALCCVQGKSVINSISLKEGEDVFLAHAKEAKKFGAAVLCMAFDEKGQADTLERRVAVCRRMYHLLTEQAGFDPGDIIFDVNVFAVATGLPEHDSYGVDFIEAIRILKQDFPACHFSGGISNVSFSFRGNEPVRAALHSVFLYHAIRAGLDMGIVNPAQLSAEIDSVLRTAAEDVILNSSPDAGAKLLEIASGFAGEKLAANDGPPQWRSESLEDRIRHALIHGDDAYIREDMAEALKKYADPVQIIEGPLMDGMEEVGVRFGAGKMFLPQIVKTARVMKNAVAELMPVILQNNTAGAAARKTVVFATVKGDVHDIGKNIVSVVLQCNGFRVVDLGVMVPCETIIETAIKEHADIIALSGLITPSLEEMALVADELEKRKLNIPLMVGGAAASQVHTALKLQCRYPSGIVAYTTDASRCAPVARQLADPEKRDAFIAQLKEEYAKIAAEHAQTAKELIPFTDAAAKAEINTDPAPAPAAEGVTVLDLAMEDVVPYINWNAFKNAWDLSSSPHTNDAGACLLCDAKKMLAQFPFVLKAAVGIFPAKKIDADTVEVCGKRLPFLRQQTGSCRSLADLICGHLGFFVLTAGHGVAEGAAKFREENDDYSALLLQTLAGSLAEAAAEYLHKVKIRELWSDDLPTGIRPAIGYPPCPDHTLKRDIFDLLNAEKALQVHLTDSMMIDPPSSVCAFLIPAEGAKYFSVEIAGGDQLAVYAEKRGIPAEKLKKFIACPIQN